MSRLDDLLAELVERSVAFCMVHVGQDMGKEDEHQTRLRIEQVVRDAWNERAKAHLIMLPPVGSDLRLQKMLDSTINETLGFTPEQKQWLTAVWKNGYESAKGNPMPSSQPPVMLEELKKVAWAYIKNAPDESGESGRQGQVRTFIEQAYEMGKQAGESNKKPTPVVVESTHVVTRHAIEKARVKVKKFKRAYVHAIQAAVDVLVAFQIRAEGSNVLLGNNSFVTDAQTAMSVSCLTEAARVLSAKGKVQGAELLPPPGPVPSNIKVFNSQDKDVGHGGGIFG